MISRLVMRIRMLDALGDQRPRTWAGRPSNQEYTKDPLFRDRVANACFALFGAKCYVCGLTASKAKWQNERLTTAHILYPSEPFQEVVDTDLTRTDVVLLCWMDHRIFDDRTDAVPCDSIEEIRDLSIAILLRMKTLRSTGEELPDDAD